ncbi:MAG: hypothetical protein RL255_169 [Actinomycetota bacterium]
MSVRKTVHSSGLRIVTEKIPDVRSAAFGIWVNVGSRDESPKSDDQRLRYRQLLKLSAVR